MEQMLAQGANAPLQDGGSVSVVVTWDAQAGPGLDASALLITAGGKVRSDDDLVFFNQPSSPDGSVTHLGSAAGHDRLAVALDRVPAAIERVVITASVDAAVAGGTTFAAVKAMRVRVEDGSGRAVIFEPAGLSTETALVLVELYRRQGVWKVRAVGQGYAAGLAGIATTYGITVANDDPAEIQDEAPVAEPAVRVAPAEPAVSLTKPMPVGLPVDLQKRIGPRLEKANAVLLRKGLAGVTAQVALIVERVMAVAERFDDDGRMDVWQFASGFRRLHPLELPDLDAYVGTHMRKAPRGVGFGNNEPLVMADVLAFYRGEPSVPLGLSSKEARKLEKVERRGRRAKRLAAGEQAVAGTDPVYIVFISDGGIYANDKITELLVEASSSPIFWQFVGIGRADYGILEEFDTLTGRRVDNAGFFALDDIDKVDDDTLYDRLLSEFPDWLTAARAAGVLAD
jgi:stress response protein SCP2